ncbi:uncharacterized protein LOC144436273 [Glandiceps talaboti]
MKLCLIILVIPIFLTVTRAANEDCVDKDFQCADWAINGECQKNPLYMLPNCRISCKQCVLSDKDCVDKNIQCADWAINGECQKNPLYMLPNCRISCKQCVLSDKDCVDKDIQCADWAINGECQKNPLYMLPNCRISCKQCALSDIELPTLHTETTTVKQTETVSAYDACGPLTNIAAGKSVSQSSDKPKGDYGAENAVDGDTNPDIDQGSCTQTKRETNPWLKIDLGRSRNVNAVVIYHQGGDLGRLVKGTVVRVGDNNTHSKNTICGIEADNVMKKENPIQIVCNDECTPIRGRYVSIEFPGSKEKSLSLCEVEIMTK